jgi:hypothetical protein
MMLIILFLFTIISLALFALAMLGISLSLLDVPFVSVSSEALDTIIKALDLNSQSILYDLGSGDGKVLFACFNFYTMKAKPRYVGIEYHFFPHILATMKLRRLERAGISGTENIQLINSSFFKQDLSNATHVFVYLFPSMLDKLLPKLEKELKRGTRLISCDFTFSKKQPIEIIDIPGAEIRKRCKKLYVYKFE